MKKVLLLLAFALYCLTGMGQNANLYFDHIDIKKGLPEGYVRKIVEDAEGYMWLSTQNGLVRYDGYQTKVYRLGDDAVNPVASTNISGLLRDANNQIWVSTIGNGLFKYNRAKDDFIRFAYPMRGIAQFNLQAIDREGNLWGQFNVDDIGAFFKFDTLRHQFEIFGNKEKGSHHINADAAYIALATADGAIWLASSNGLYHYNGPGKALTSYFEAKDKGQMRGVYPVYAPPSEPGVLWMNTFLPDNVDLNIIRLDTRTGKMITYGHRADNPNSIKSDSLYAIYEDSGKQLWFGTQHGLSKFDRKTQRFINYIPNDTLRSPGKNIVHKIVESRTGGLWLYFDTGLGYFDQATGNFTRYRADADNIGSLSSEKITSMIVDHTKIPWIGTIYAGVNKVNRVKSAFHIYTKKTGQINGYPGGPALITPTRDGNYLSIKKALYRWLPDHTFKKVFEPDITPGVIEAFCQDKSGLIYIGTNNGFFTFNPATGGHEVYRSDPKDSSTICSNFIGNVLIDHTGIVWIGSQDQHGLCSFDPASKKFTRYPFKPISFNKNLHGELDDSGPLCIYEDHEGTIWVGTNWGSLNRFNRETQKFSSMLNKRNASLTCVNTIFEDKSGRLWAGTYMNGLFEVDRKRNTYIHHYTEANGLLFDGIISINEDKQGQVWVLSQRGLSRLEPQTGRIKNFTVDNSVPGYTISNGYPLVRLEQGQLGFAVSNGIVIFNPEEIKDNPYPPIVHITDISYGNPRSGDHDVETVLAYGRTSLSLAYNQNRVTFSYVGLHYENPAENTYAYKLDGYDKDWIKAGTQRTVSYTNLPPGHYTFMVKAANSDGVWTTQAAAIALVISWPWWFTWWSVLLYIASFCFAVYWFIKYRSRKLIEENQLLEEKVSVRTKQLSEHQEEITAQRDQLAETVTELKTTQQQLIQSEKMASLGELTAGIAHEIQNPLNFVNNFSEVSMEMIDEMEVELDKGDKDEAIAIAADIKQNLEKILHHGKRADNIVKGMLQHSRATSTVKEPVNINALADEYLRLAYHGLRAKDKTFNAELVTAFTNDLPLVKAVPQDLGRVLLNLFNNGFYSVHQKQKTAGPGYKPTLTITTSMVKTAASADNCAISVHDNGLGMPDAVKDKILQPFFTTKPTGEGTGLGLSISYDIVVKGHNGTIKVDSREGEFAEITLLLPLT